ncbi:DUF2949 domain-containing protein [Floridanema aerugineum]|uniref:DUF2949 domain-containing protein n=1 Tax=Floridaenema aerugineum BLCC-F46 TaxID=3153654 RepID=A0ABV4X8R4_9CYAN
MEAIRLRKLVNFLQEELKIPPNSLSLALRHSEQSTTSLPMILWQYGLVSLNQLEKIFDWLETAAIPASLHQ